MALGLAVADNLDGTASLAVSGTLAAAWTVVGYLLEGVAGSLAPVQQAAGTGDQTVNATPTFGGGPILWVLRSGTSETDPVYRPISRTGYAPHILAAMQVRDGIRTIGLTGVATADILLRRLPKTLGKENDRAMVIVSPYPTESERNRMSGVDDVYYPVTVAFFAPNDATMNVNMEADFMNRWRVSKAFRNHRPDGVPGAKPLQNFWKPDLPTSPYGVSQNVSCGIVVFEIGFRELRGTV